MKSLFYLLPLLGFFVSCSNIRSKQLVGAEPVNLAGLKEKGWDIAGRWTDSDGNTVEITVIDAKKGVVQYAPLKQGDSAPTQWMLRQSGDYYFANIWDEKSKESRWLMLGGNGNQIFAWEADREAFRKLIAEGKIKGANDPEPKADAPPRKHKQAPGAVIDDPKGEWVNKMIAGEFGVLVDWRHPRVLTRAATKAGEAAGK